MAICLEDPTERRKLSSNRQEMQHEDSPLLHQLPNYRLHLFDPRPQTTPGNGRNVGFAHRW
jgi:hypothetical protein